MSKLVWVDVETTGLDAKKNQIIELAAIYEYNGEYDKFHCYCAPFEKPKLWIEEPELQTVDWEWLKANGLTEQELYKNFTTWLATKINKFDKNDKASFIAYNASFDVRFVRALFEKNGDNFYGSFFDQIPLNILQTVKLAVKLGFIKAPANYKLVTVTSHLGITLDNAHSGIADIKASRKVQLYLEKLLKGKR